MTIKINKETEENILKSAKCVRTLTLTNCTEGYRPLIQLLTVMGRGSAADPVSHLSVSFAAVLFVFVVLSDQTRIFFVAK